jgi:formyl-CoA transferase
MQFTVSSPIQVHGVDKVSAMRAPELGEHNEEILQDLGFDPKQIDSFLASGAVTEHREQTIK